MIYELAKELKDAGFDAKMNTGIRRGHYNDSKGSENLVYFPILEELIEACGEGFGCLLNNGSFWQANHATKSIEGTGPTPAEAVARLWLALNK